MCPIHATLQEYRTVGTEGLPLRVGAPQEVLKSFLTAANQMQSALRGLVLLDVYLPLDWERVVELKFGPRLDNCTHRLYLEIMGK